MKKNTEILIIMACLSSCAIEEPVSQYAPSVDRLYAGLETTNITTKTSLDSGNKVVWNKGDKIALYNINISTSVDGDSYAGTTYTLEDQYDGKEIGAFSGFSPFRHDSYSTFCTYPEDGNQYHSRAYVENGVALVQYTLPSSQTLVNGSFGKCVNFSVGKEKTKKGFYLFRNVLGLLKISITGTVSIKWISLKSDIDEPLWGEAVVDMSYGEEGPVMVFKQSKDDVNRNVLILESVEGVLLSDNQPASFYFNLPPGSLSKGFCITICSDDGKQMSMHGSLPTGKSIQRSVITPMPVIAFSGSEVTPDDNDNYVMVTHSNSVFQAPAIFGIGDGWKIFWGDGIGSLYYPGISHTYLEQGKHSVSIQTNDATRVEVEQLMGIESIDFSQF